MRRTLFVIFLFAAALIVVPGAQAQTLCKWQAEPHPDHVRSPVQMDIHAGYRIFAFHSDGTIGYRLSGEFPYAAFLSFTTYNGADGLLYNALLDYQIKPDPGSKNPFQAGELVNYPDRSYTVTVLPADTVPDVANPIFMPPLPPGSNLMTVVLVQRIYLAEPGVKPPPGESPRFGGVEAPTIEPFEVSNPATPAGCPSGDFSAITSQVESFGGNFSQSPLPRNGRIEFYRPPVSGVPFADGSHQETEQDCTDYLEATVFPDQIAVIHLPKVPRFFDNTDTTALTTFPKADDVDVRYLSLGSYGAHVLPPFNTKGGVLADENIAGPDVKTLADGSATFVAIPVRMSRSDTDDAAAKADGLGYNVMPLAESGLLFPQGPLLNPFLIYRNKVSASGFAGSIPQKVPCFKGKNFSHAPRVYAASPANMDTYAPVGIECSLEDFLYGGCGQ